MRSPSGEPHSADGFELQQIKQNLVTESCVCKTEDSKEQVLPLFVHLKHYLIHCFVTAVQQYTGVHMVMSSVMGKILQF